MVHEWEQLIFHHWNGFKIFSNFTLIVRCLFPAFLWCPLSSRKIVVYQINYLAIDNSGSIQRQDTSGNKLLFALIFVFATSFCQCKCPHFSEKRFYSSQKAIRVRNIIKEMMWLVVEKILRKQSKTFPISSNSVLIICHAHFHPEQNWVPYL